MSLHHKTFAKLLKSLKDQSKFEDEYIQDENCNDADYVSGMGDGDYDLSRIDNDELQAQAQKLEHVMDEDNFKAMLIECSDLTYIPDMYNRSNEIYSLVLGETEHQIDEELWELCKKCSPKQFETLRREVGIYSHCNQTNSQGYFYGSHDYERWALIFNEEKFEKWLSKNPMKIKFTKKNAIVIEGQREAWQPSKPIGKLGVAS